ncbi:MAG: SEC-C metal-binding domain-containing protein, partial [Bacteroidota bacterium]
RRKISCGRFINVHDQGLEVLESLHLATGDLSFPENNQPAIRQAKQRKTDLSKTQTNRTETQQAMHRAAQNAGGGARRRQKVETFQRAGVKVGRNDPCPCGSGKKYKKCHGR